VPAPAAEGAPAGAPEEAAPAGAPDEAAPAPAEAGPDPSESLPYVEIPEEVTLTDLVNIAHQCKNPLQRAELIARIVAGGKSIPVLKMLRTFATAAHPLVRAAAEEGLTKLFGASWGQKREIQRPVQPPRSDD
jgi:hypothetical protein